MENEDAYIDTCGIMQLCVSFMNPQAVCIPSTCTKLAVANDLSVF